MKLTQEQYKKMYTNASNKTKSYITIPKAFIIGGLICTFGEALSQIYNKCGLSSKNTAMLVTITLIFLSALLTGLGLYSKLARHAGAGTLVPITGFANSVVSPAIEFKTEGYILGLGAKIFIICGPVILYGITASIIYGFIYWLTIVI
ncbi:MAG: stage V sporulation protein AC [Clostridiales bacterium]|nr:stage V sporulation protein AC [Clostridiales bacterium]